MFATPIFNLSANSIVLPSWAADCQRFVFQAAIYSQAAAKAFNSAIAPRLIATTLTLSRYTFQAGQACGLWVMDAAGIEYNPFRAAYDELTSAEAMATYCRIRCIARETAMDALVIGLCGVVVIATSIEVSQAGYRKAVALYQLLDQRFSPSLSTLWMAMPFRDHRAATVDEIQRDRHRLIQRDELNAVSLAAVQSPTDTAIAQFVVAPQLKADRAALALQVECDRQAQAQLAYVVDRAIEFSQSAMIKRSGLEEAIESQTEASGAETIALPQPKPTRKPRQRREASTTKKPTATKSQRKSATA
jgi:hypothetical protein